MWWRFVGKLLRCQGITLQSPEPAYPIINLGSSSNVWVDGCKLLGSGQWSNQSNPIGYGAGTWYTDCYITNVDFATPAAWFARGLTIEHIGNDAFALCPMVVNCTADDLNPGATGWHTDAWQWYGGGQVSLGLKNGNGVVRFLTAGTLLDHKQAMAKGIGRHIEERG